MSLLLVFLRNRGYKFHDSVFLQQLIKVAGHFTRLSLADITHPHAIKKLCLGLVAMLDTTKIHPGTYNKVEKTFRILST